MGNFVNALGRRTTRISSGIANPAGEIARNRGVSTSNTGRQLFDITGVTQEKSQDAYNKGGLSAVKSLIKSGDLTDPAGIFHNLGGPADTSVDAPPSPLGIEQSSLMAKDRIRRRARQAQGLQSTIRSTASTLYTDQPKSLLGS